MSISNEHPNWDTKNEQKSGITNDSDLTNTLINLMGFEHPVSTIKNIAVALELKNHYRVRHLKYRHSRITAFEFLKLLMKYERIRQYFGLKKMPHTKNPFLRMENRDELQKKVLILCAKNPKICAREISHKLSISKKVVEYIILCLKQKRLLKHIGSARNGFWKTKGVKHEKKNRNITNQSQSGS